MGSDVVYADFTQIIVCTGKTNLADASTYVNYLVDTLQKNELFKWIDLTPRQYWGQLLFMDGENFGGVLLDAEESVQMHWNMALYLTPHALEEFEILIAKFLLLAYQRNRDQYLEAQKAGTALPLQKQRDTMTTFLNVLVTETLTSDSMKAVQRVESVDQTTPFPVLAGSHLNLTNPALEFVKTLCHVLHLDEDIKHAIDILKGQLLRLVGVRDFSPESQWQNPSLVFVLHDVICEACNKVADLDLCRNPTLTTDEVSVDERWRCTCGNQYNLGTIEHRLVDQVEALFTKSQLQDLRCTKCGSIKVDNLREYCDCSGRFECSEAKPEELLKQLNVYKRVAQWHKMEWLLEVTTSLEQLTL